jgi:hypothetical protein
VRRALYPAYIALPRVGVAVLFVLVRCERPARLCVAERLRCRASNALRPCCVRLQRRATGAGHSIPPPAVRHDVAICHAGPAGEKCAQAYSHIPGIPRVCVCAHTHTHTHTHTHARRIHTISRHIAWMMKQTLMVYCIPGSGKLAPRRQAGNVGSSSRSEHQVCCCYPRALAVQRRCVLDVSIVARIMLRFFSPACSFLSLCA